MDSPANLSVDENPVRDEGSIEDNSLKRKKSDDDNDEQAQQVSIKIPKTPPPSVVKFLPIKCVTPEVFKNCVSLAKPFKPAGRCELVSIVFNEALYNSVYADGVLVPKLFPKYGKYLPIRTPWLLAPFGYEPFQAGEAKTWQTNLRLSFENFPDPEEAAQYIQQLGLFREMVAERLRANSPDGKPIICGLSEFKKTEWEDKVPTIREITRLIDPIVKSAKTDGFPDYQKIKVATQRQTEKQAADHTVVVDVENFYMKDLDHPVPLTSIKKNYYVQAGMILKHLAILPKITISFELRQSKYGTVDDVFERGDANTVRCGL